MHTRRALVAAAILVLWLSVSGCGKKPSETVKALNAENQPVVSQPAPDASAPENSIANAAAPPFAKKPVASTGPVASNATVESAQAPAIIPAGTPIIVRLQQSLSSASAVPGERFEAVLDQPVVIDDRTLLPVGALVTGHVVSARHSGRLRHPGVLALTLDSVTVGDRHLRLATWNIVASGRSHQKRNLGWIGGGTGGGALIGALAAGGKGALIGSGIGAAAGTTTAFITGKKDVAFGVERRLSFHLNRNVSLAT